MQNDASNYSRTRAEDSLSRYFGRRHCVLTGRGASAIYSALRALVPNVGKVVLPAIVCPSAVNPVIYAGFEPIFCDIDLDDFTMDVKSLERVLSEHKNVVAIIVVHLYGHPANIDGIVSLARSKNLLVIEDACQAMGGSYGTMPLGSFGDMSIVSFGHTKIVDIGCGGCVLTDDAALAKEIRNFECRLPDMPSNIQERIAEYRNAYYRLEALIEGDSSAHTKFLELPHKFRDIYLFRFDLEMCPAIEAGLHSLDQAVAARRRNFDLYCRVLNHRHISLPTLRAGVVPWRLSFLVEKGMQKPLITALRSRGIDVSRWYPALHRWYAAGRKQNLAHFEKAILFEERVINLWVDPSKNDAYIRATAGEVNAILAEIGSSREF